MSVKQIDLALEFYDWCLSEHGLKVIFERNRKQFKHMYSTKIPKNYILYASDLSYIIAKAEESKRNLRTVDTFFQPSKYQESWRNIKNIFTLISLIYSPLRIIPPSYCHSQYSINYSNQIMKAVYDAGKNLFCDFFNETTIPLVRQETPRVIGLSIVDESQLIPSMILARLIKEVDKSIYIVTGGPIVTSLRERLPHEKELFTLFDAAIIFEGERPLYELVRSLQENQEMSEVPNLIYATKNTIKVTPTKAPENIDALPTPDFDDIQLHRYFLPKPVLPIYSTRGCYWRKCAFCGWRRNGRPHYHQRPVETVVRDMIALSAKYSVNHFTFTDATIPLARMRDISNALYRSKNNIEWCCMSRLDGNATKQVYKEIRRGGMQTNQLWIRVGFPKNTSTDEQGY